MLVAPDLRDGVMGIGEDFCAIGVKSREATKGVKPQTRNRGPILPSGGSETGEADAALPLGA